MIFRLCTVCVLLSIWRIQLKPVTHSEYETLIHNQQNNCYDLDDPTVKIFPYVLKATR